MFIDLERYSEKDEFGGKVNAKLIDLKVKSSNDEGISYFRPTIKGYELSVKVDGSRTSFVAGSRSTRVRDKNGKWAPFKKDIVEVEGIDASHALVSQKVVYQGGKVQSESVKCKVQLGSKAKPSPAEYEETDEQSAE
jgi:hypothetical protein